MKIIYYSFLFIIVITSSCNNTSNKLNNPYNKTSFKYTKSIQINKRLKNTIWKQNTNIPIEIEHIRKNKQIDSIEIYLDNKKQNTIYNNNFKTSLSIKHGKVGTRRINAIAYHPYGKNGFNSIKIQIVPDKEPTRYSFEVIKTYKHDTTHFTEGLFFKNGFLYEGTGIKGESSIYKIDLNNNKTLFSRKIDQEYFGEGITALNNKLFQLTWKSKKGFVYNINNFKLESELEIDTEGWGITTIDDNLVISNGTNVLHFINKDSYKIIKKLEICDNNGPINYINELEYIYPYIYANVWQKNKIIIIEPTTGKVIGIVDLTSIITKENNFLTDNENVLNGIAYDKLNKRLFITGKRWSKIFQIKLINSEKH